MKRSIKITLLIIITIITILGTSYALYVFNVSQQNSNILQGDCLNIEVTEKNDITIQKNVPIPEDEAQDLIPYEITIKNVCDHAASYDVNIETINTSSLNLSFVRYKIDNDESNILGNATSTSDRVNNNVSDSRTIKQSTLLPNEQITHKVKLWLDEDATLEAANKSYTSKLVIVSTLNLNPYHTITLDANGGQNNNNTTTIQVIDNRPLDLGSITSPTKTDFVFDGWYTDSTAGTKITSQTQFRSDMTIYAHWKAAITNLVTYLRSLPQDNTSVVQDDLSGDANMRYVGSNPNNYILFGCSDETNPTLATCELWQIIGVFDSNTHNDSNDLVKIIKSSSIGNFRWDARMTSGTNYFDGSSIQQEVNSSTYPYATSTLAKSLTHKDGATSNDYETTVGGAINIYNGERSNTKSKAYFYVTTWTGVVVLPYISDYIYATSGEGTLSSRNTCINQTALRIENGVNQYWKSSPTVSLRGTCSNNSWLIKKSMDADKEISTMSAVTNNQTNLYYVYNNRENGAISSGGAANYYAVYPSVYLKENTKCLNCYESNAGTSSNPFKVVLDNN